MDYEIQLTIDLLQVRQSKASSPLIIGSGGKP